MDPHVRTVKFTIQDAISGVKGHCVAVSTILETIIIALEIAGKEKVSSS